VCERETEREREREREKERERERFFEYTSVPPASSLRDIVADLTLAKALGEPVFPSRPCNLHGHPSLPPPPSTESLRQGPPSALLCLPHPRSIPALWPPRQGASWLWEENLPSYYSPGLCMGPACSLALPAHSLSHTFIPCRSSRFCKPHR
jgi:hypothetical protein